MEYFRAAEKLLEPILEYLIDKDKFTKREAEEVGNYFIDLADDFDDQMYDKYGRDGIDEQDLVDEITKVLFQIYEQLNSRSSGRSVQRHALVRRGGRDSRVKIRRNGITGQRERETPTDLGLTGSSRNIRSTRRETKEDKEVKRPERREEETTSSKQSYSVKSKHGYRKLSELAVLSVTDPKIKENFILQACARKDGKTVESISQGLISHLKQYILSLEYSDSEKSSGIIDSYILSELLPCFSIPDAIGYMEKLMSASEFNKNFFKIITFYQYETINFHDQEIFKQNYKRLVSKYEAFLNHSDSDETVFGISARLEKAFIFLRESTSVDFITYMTHVILETCNNYLDRKVFIANSKIARLVLKELKHIHEIIDPNDALKSLQSTETYMKTAETLFRIIETFFLSKGNEYGAFLPKFLDTDLDDYLKANVGTFITNPVKGPVLSIFDFYKNEEGSQVRQLFLNKFNNQILIKRKRMFVLTNLFTGINDDALKESKFERTYIDTSNKDIRYLINRLLIEADAQGDIENYVYYGGSDFVKAYKLGKSLNNLSALMSI